MIRAFEVRLADWVDDGDALQSIRLQVFVHEQLVPVELEWDGLDAGCIHLIAEDAAGRGIGCARLLPQGRIGRMAVLRDWRGQGVGRALLRATLSEAASAGFSEVLLSAQLQALGFYAREGFEPFGTEFMDAGIPHREMRRSIAP